jgi:hypothetical protein
MDGSKHTGAPRADGPQTRGSTSRPLLRGFLALGGVNLAFLVLGWMLVHAFPRHGPGPWYPPLAPPVYLIGLTQLLWALPWQTWAFATRRTRFGFGLALATVATMLVNLAGAIALFSSMGVH